ncbi:MAG: nucleoid-associated protein [Campylobacteraceae bacterium]|jgi:hypothetical protein|nr:nucleoid-associated protein [Campylobacteraceae bacterium]
MIDCIKSNIGKVAIHKVGNKYNEEFVQLAKTEINISNFLIREILVKYFILPFKSSEYFNFYHNIDINMNEVFACVSKIFANPGTLLGQSQNLAKHLYEQSVHPKIKSGEFYTVYFKDCIIEGVTTDAIGLFKSENKETFLKIYPAGEGFEIESDKGININKLDKGCLIFNIEQEKGYVVAVVDNTAKSTEAKYWIDDFLHIRKRKDEYYNTQNILLLYKDFIKNELPQQIDISKVDQIDLLNKSAKFFKEKDDFDMKEFVDEVMSEQEIIDRFNRYKSDYQQEYDLNIADNFPISKNAFKKQARTFRSIIKLDKNFHIYIHGNRDLIEQGKDEKGQFYKIYYNEDS